MVSITLIPQFGRETPAERNNFYDLTQPPTLFFDGKQRAEFARITALPMQPSHALYATGRENALYTTNIQNQPVNLNNNADAAIAGALLFVGLIGLGILIGGTGGLAVVALGLAACSSLESIGDPVFIERIGYRESSNPSISADGRFVAFQSFADSNPWESLKTASIFVSDLQTRKTERITTGTVNVDSDGTKVYGGISSDPSISADGRFVAFASSTYTVNDAKRINSTVAGNVFVYDRQTKQTELVSVDSKGTQGNSGSYDPFISADGQFVAFISDATNLVPEDTNGKRGIFVRDRKNKKTERVSNGLTPLLGDWNREGPSISADGRFVAFYSDSSNLVPDDTNNVADVFVYDRKEGKTERVNIGPNGVEADGDSFYSSISADGQSVVFYSTAFNLVPRGVGGVWNAFVYNRETKKMELAGTSSDQTQIEIHGLRPSISADGRFSAFALSRTSYGIFVHDRQTGKTERVSVNADGVEPNDNCWNPSISADGHFVAFYSSATNLVPEGTNGSANIFVVGLEHFFE